MKITIGAVVKGGTSLGYKTGNWRDERPVLDMEKTGRRDEENHQGEPRGNFPFHGRSLFRAFLFFPGHGCHGSALFPRSASGRSLFTRRRGSLL